VVQQATVIGTRMSEAEITAYLGYLPEKYNKELTQLSQEICVIRGYFKMTVAKKIKFYRLPETAYKKLTDGQEVMLETLKSGKKWQPDVAYMFLDFKEAQTSANANYPYGEMNIETRLQYVHDISDFLGDKFHMVNLLN
jgi:hypothetical protein